MTGLSSVSRAGILGVALMLNGCASLTSARQSASDALGTGRTFAIYGLEGRWAGAVTPVAADCGPVTRGVMTVGAHGFAFDPFGSTFVINGSFTEAGDFQGELKRVVNADGGKRRERSLRFTGKGERPADGQDRISGQLVSGRCTWQVTLQRS